MKEKIYDTTRKKAAVGEEELSGLDAVSKASLAVMGGISGIIGIWAMVALVSAMVRVGPLDLFRSWLQAVTGM